MLKCFFFNIVSYVNNYCTITLNPIRPNYDIFILCIQKYRSDLAASYNRFSKKYMNIYLDIICF